MARDYGGFDDNWSEDLPPDRVADPGDRRWLLILGTVAVVLSLLLLVPDGPVPLTLGYILAAPLTFTLVAMYRRWRSERYVRVGIVASPAQMRWANVLLVAGLLVAIAQAARIGIALS